MYVQIYPEDGLPDCICSPCSDELQSAFAFRMKCVRSHCALFALLFESKPIVPVETGSPHAARRSEVPDVKNVLNESTSIVVEVDIAPLKEEADDSGEENISVILKPESESEDDDYVVDNAADDPDFETCLQDENGDNTDDDEDEDDKPVIKSPPKRGRGRPRKIRPELTGDATEPDVAATTAAAAAATPTTPTQHACPECNRVFARRIHMTRHRLIHSDEKPFACDICPKRFRRQDHLNIHRHHHADVKPFGCEHCGRGFTRVQHLQKHVLSQHGDKDAKAAASARSVRNKIHICEICKRGFTTVQYLAVHRRMHERDFTCKLCDLKCADKAELAEHGKEHTDGAGGDDKPFLCSECGMRFVRNDYLVIHMRRHKGEKPYKCRYCGKGFPRATDLTVHERYHTGEKTHLCTTCGKGFHRAYNLVVHMRIHTGERPYQCPHCDRSFAQGNDLKAHVRRHTGERYKCDVCGEGFIQGYHLTHHKMKVHGVDVKSHIRRVQKFAQKGQGQRKQRAGAAPVAAASAGGEPVSLVVERLEEDSEREEADVSRVSM